MRAAGQVTRQLLALGRRESRCHERVDLNDLVAGTLSLGRRSIHADVALTHERGIPSLVNVDRVQIEQALANLVINARDAVQASGSITVSVEPCSFDDDALQRQPWARRGEFARVRVHDTGPGIPATLILPGISAHGAILGWAPSIERASFAEGTTARLLSAAMELDLDLLEGLALAPDRPAALGALLPGTPIHDYWRGVHLQHEGRLDEVEAIITEWSGHHPNEDALRERLERRQLFLRAGRDLAAYADTLRFEAGITLDDQAEAEVAAQRYPTRLDPALLDVNTLIHDGLDRATDLSQLADWALPYLVAYAPELDVARVRDLLARLPRANLPGVIDLVARELAEPSSRGFSSLMIQHALTLDQLLALAAIRPALVQDATWVGAVLARHTPPAHVDLRTDLDARAAYLDAIWAFAEPLAPSFNSLKSQILQHRLDLDRRLGALDRARFLRYLELPRAASYIEPTWLRRFPADQIVQTYPGAGIAGLDAPGDDEALVRDHLHHFLAHEELDAFAGRLRLDWLRVEMAIARLLADDPDTRRWNAMLGESALVALADRVDIELSPRNPARFDETDAVTLDVFVKNVTELQIKVFRVNVLAYFLARGEEIDTSLDLDGMVASDERALRFDAAPIRRAQITIDLPGCARPGTYVVELIGNGRSSRAVIRKGALGHTARVGVAGPTLTVFDEAGRVLRDARVWMGGREYTPREDGEISIPFSTQPARVPMLLIHGDRAQRAMLDHPGETYALEAGFQLDRQALVAGKTARILLRPLLSVAGTSAPIALLEEARVEITVTDFGGVTSTKIEPVKLQDDAETALDFRVPEDAVWFSAWLRGRVRVASTQATLDLDAGGRAAINVIHGTDQTELMHLATTDAGHVLHLLGKSGEPRPGRAITVSFKHAAVNFEVSTTLSTDDRGRIELGPLPFVERVSALQEAWNLAPVVNVPAASVAEAGAEIVFPAPPSLTENDLPIAVRLSELRGIVMSRDCTARDCTDRVRIDRRALRIDGLSPGRYELACRGWPGPIGIVVVAAAADRSREASKSQLALLEVPPPLPLLRDLAVEGSAIVARLSGAGPDTRVHLIATLFRPMEVMPRSLAEEPREHQPVALPQVRSDYVSGRDIGDEYRYVLARRGAAPRPGVLVEKPSLLLNPWALRTTSMALQNAVAGGAYGVAAMPAPSPRRTRGGGGYASESIAAGPGASFDFLAAPAPVIANLRPDADGFLRVQLADLGAAQLVQIIVVDPALTSTAELALPEITPAHRDRRLRLALDSKAHFAEERRVEPLPQGTTIVVDDVRTGKLELVDTLARAHQVLLTLRPDDALRDFAFVTRWPSLDAAEQQRKYAKYACHELDIFLAEKDPPFFAGTIRPYLANKLHPTFIDHYLLGEDLRAHLDPWAFSRLNTLERILLARRHPELRASITRLIGDAVDCIPPDPALDARLVDTLLGSARLETAFLGGAADALDELAMPEAAADSSLRMKKAMRRSLDDETTRGGDGYGPPEPRSPAPSFAPPQSSSMSPGRAASAGPGGGGGRAQRDLADLREREQAPALFRGADKTEEWAETSYWKKRVDEATADLIPPTRFLRDLALHEGGPFLSPHLAEHTSSFAAALTALAFLDLPFTAAAHTIVVDETRLTLTAASHALAARTRITPIAEPASRGPILVGQRYVRADDASIWDGVEQREKYVVGELLIAVVYECRITVTNPTSSAARLDVLLQIPRGAVPVAGGFLTKTRHLRLGPYGTEALAYSFYFPAPGRFPHFPAHVILDGELAAFAEPTTLDVARELTTADVDSWAHVSQHATTDAVLAYLERENLGRIPLARIAWRMRDRDAFTRVTALLATRHTYDGNLWSYALLHGDRQRAAEWLPHQDALLEPAGPLLEGGLAPIDPVARGDYQHLEYAPLINARAHQLGKRRRILDDALAAQYRAFLEVVAHRAQVSDADLLAAAHYAFTLERVDEALRLLDRVRPEGVTARLQLDYLLAYAACCRGDLAAARALATPFVDHPVDRWRVRFTALTAMLDEVLGRASTFAPNAADPVHRDRTIADLAARQPTLALVVDHGQLVLQHKNLTACQVRFYRMDIELLFSRQPFVQGDVERFSWIDAGHTLDLDLDLDLDLALGEGGRTPVPIPEAMRGANLVVDAVAAGLRRSIAHYAHDLGVEVADRYGQFRVVRASTQGPLAAAYVKVYARQRGGAVAFYKDGYTDLRGRFDYATLSTDDLDRVERFALLIVSDDAGATVLEAAPPTR